MHIAFDASFTHLPPSGTGAYVRHLCDALQAADPALCLDLLHPAWSTDEPPSRRQRLAWELWDVRNAAKRKTPDLLHIPHFSAPIMPLGVPLVVTIHDVIPFVLEQYRASRAMRLRLALTQQTVKRARLILTPSLHAARDIERVLRVTQTRIRVIPEAAGSEYRPLMTNAERCVARKLVKRLGIREPYIFNAAGHDVRKNLPILIEAFALAKRHLPEHLSLVIAGEPHSSNQTVYPPLRPVIEQLGLGENLILPGFVTEAEKIALYQLASLYVTPSSYEGFGLTALEAMACGVPVIAANRTSLPEIVGDGGVLCEPVAEQVAESIIAILTKRATHESFAQAALNRAAIFSWHTTAHQTLAAYREALAMSNQGDR
jgi:glycosyltransferase involved in cell wall biosynthesis